jgi:hypothetical protein
MPHSSRREICLNEWAWTSAPVLAPDPSNRFLWFSFLQTVLATLPFFDQAASLLSDLLLDANPRVREAALDAMVTSLPVEADYYTRWVLSQPWPSHCTRRGAQVLRCRPSGTH